jgi:hypothetical protein
VYLRPTVGVYGHFFTNLGRELNFTTIAGGVSRLPSFHSFLGAQIKAQIGPRNVCVRLSRMLRARYSLIEQASGPRGDGRGAENNKSAAA